MLAPFPKIVQLLHFGLSHLDKGGGIKLVLGSNLELRLGRSVGVPGGLGTSLNLGVDAVVVRSGEHAQVVGGGDGSGVLGNGVTNGSSIAGDAASLDIVADLGTSEETVVADSHVTLEGGSLEEVEEGTGVEEGLLEVNVELGALAGVCGEELGEDFGLEALGDGVVELDLGVESVEGGPGLGESQA